MASFAHAVISPFDIEAEGAQCPDNWCFPTSTAHIKTSFKVRSGTNGDFDFCFSPALLASVYSGSSATVTGMTTQVLYPVQTAPVTVAQPAVNAVVTPSTLQSWDQYRLLGAGIRLRSMLIPQTSTGTLYMCQTPAGPKILNVADATLIPAVNGASSVAGTNYPNLQLLNHYVPISSTTVPDPGGNAAMMFDPVFQSMPTGKVMEHFELNNEGVEIALRPITPQAFEWRSGNNNTAVNATQQFVENGLITNATGVFTASATGESAYDNTAGWSSAYFRGVGFPNASVVFTGEIIYHVEYIPLTPSLINQGTFPPVNQGELDLVCNQAARAPMYRSIKNPNIDAQMYSRLGF